LAEVAVLSSVSITATAAALFVRAQQEMNTRAFADVAVLFSVNISTPAAQPFG
jgi:hypothetical protein